MPVPRSSDLTAVVRWRCRISRMTEWRISESRWCLFLDVDGTLLDIAATPGRGARRTEPAGPAYPSSDGPAMEPSRWSAVVRSWNSIDSLVRIDGPRPACTGLSAETRSGAGTARTGSTSPRSRRRGSDFNNSRAGCQARSSKTRAWRSRCITGRFLKLRARSGVKRARSCERSVVVSCFSRAGWSSSCGRKVRPRRRPFASS